MKPGRELPLVYSCSGASSAAQIRKRHGLQADKHYDLGKMGVKKKYHEDFDPRKTAQALQRIMTDSGLAGHPTATRNDTPEPSSPTCYLREFPDY